MKQRLCIGEPEWRYRHLEPERFDTLSVVAVVLIALSASTLATIAVTEESVRRAHIEARWGDLVEQAGVVAGWRLPFYRIAAALI